MVSRGNNRDRANNDRSDNSYGRDPFGPSGDDSATRFIPRDQGDDSATRYIPRDQGGYQAGNQGGYNPDADFAGDEPTQYFGDSTAETRFEPAGPQQGSGQQGPGGNGNGGGQYWAPLSDEERGYNQANQTQQYGAGGNGNYGNPGNPGGPVGSGNGNNNDDNKSGRGKSVAIVAIAAVVAVVAIVALVLSFTSGGSDKEKESTQATSSSTSSSTPSPTSTTSEEPTPTETEDTSTPIEDTRQRIEDELNNLREAPPAIPGPGERGSGWGTIPQGVAGKSPATVEVELRTNGYQNITVVDAQGNPTNSVAAIMGKVASIDPPEGQMAETDTPVTIYLQ